MRFLILSDIHANVDAFEAVLEHADGRWDRALVLGDLVGYGAEPNAIVDAIRAMQPDAVIRGNHDKAACGLDDCAPNASSIRSSCHLVILQAGVPCTAIPLRCASLRRFG